MIRACRSGRRDVRVIVLPTFTGCPAIADHQGGREQPRLPRVGTSSPSRSNTTFDPPWTTGRITEQGRAKLKEFGLAPPTGKGPGADHEDRSSRSGPIAPSAAASNTHNENPFGPTPCRALYYCEDCRQPFEQFKAGLAAGSARPRVPASSERYRIGTHRRSSDRTAVPLASLSLRHASSTRQRLPVRAIARHRVERIDYEDDAGLERDLLATHCRPGSRSVPMLVAHGARSAAPRPGTRSGRGSSRQARDGSG